MNDEKRVNERQENENLEIEREDTVNNVEIQNDEESTINKELLDKCVSLEKELKEMKDKYLRSLADLDNYRKKVLKEKKEWEYIATSRVLYKLLSIVDDFERALKSIAETSSIDEVKKGVELIYKEMLDLLKSEHVHPFDSEGERFDPTKHEAILTMESSDHEDGTILNEVSRGYKMKDRILRPAKVVVSKLPEKSEPVENEENENNEKNEEIKEE